MNLFFLRVAVLVPVLVSCVGAAEAVALSGRAMGTTWAVKFLQPPPPDMPLDAATVSVRLAARLEELEQQFSTYRPSSELSRFNASASTDWVPVSPALARVACDSAELSALTGGGFDATVGSLVLLWGFGPAARPDVLPTESEIAAARTLVGHRHLAVRLAPPALKKDHPAVSVDFSSMAKGFASDALGEVLRSLGASDHLAQVGGDLVAAGHGPDGGPWRTGIENPATATPALAAVVTLANRALSTSGDTRNVRIIAGRPHGHLIDPRTGRPTAGPLASVSVVAETCARSSALATALFVLGPEEGFALATRERFAALFLVRDGDRLVHRATPEFGRLLASGAR